MTTTSKKTRRAVLSNVLAFPALAAASSMPARAAAIDPIRTYFDALEALTDADKARLREAVNTANRGAVLCDPIFPAIEAHIAATMEMLRTGAVSAWLSYRDPQYPEAEKARAAGYDAFEETSAALTTTTPTTLRGVMALLDHIERFDAGEFNLGEENYTEHELWPSNLGADDRTDSDGEPLHMPFANWVLRNVRAAIAIHAGETDETA